MQAKHDINTGQTALRRLVETFPPDSPHWNEAQNRFQFVDRLLLESLGWEHPSIEVEHRDETGGKADYVLGSPAKGVLEAKKEALSFSLPAGTRPDRSQKLRSLVSGCKVLDAAVQQVIPYCAMRGAQLAAVCNGPQLVIFQALTPGASPLDGECFVFDGFKAYENNYTLLWNLLSPEAVAENRAYRELALRRNPRLPQKASSSLSEPMRYRYRSNFQEDLRSLASILLEDIEDQDDVKPEFYKECYVAVEANNRSLLLSKSLIGARYSRVSDNGIQSSALDTKVVDGRVAFSDDAAATVIGSRPIVVIGDVGVGKTSFFENLFQQLAEEDERESYLIHVNLGIRASLTDNLKGYVLNAITQSLKSQYDVDIESAEFSRATYHRDLVAFDSGVEGALKTVDPQEYEKAKIRFLAEKLLVRDQHLHAALGHLARGRNKQIILVIDNADQRDFDTQQEAFLIAQELAATRNMTVFVAVRPSTFYQSKLSGALSGYQNRVLTISPPPADEVIRRRIGFAVRVAEGEIAPQALAGIRLNLSNIVLFLRATLRSVRSNDQIKTFLGNITGGNTRAVVELITGFCGSPNVESERIVRIERESGSYQVPLHEFTKHALLGEYAYYNPLSSQVAFNLFDVSASDPKEHFLTCLVISLIASSAAQRDNDGFVPGGRIVEGMSHLGFIPDQTRSALRRLAAKRLIETPHAHYREVRVSDDEPPEQFVYRATSIGLYHVRHWSGSFAFIDATSIDTPIFDEDVRREVFDRAASFEISDRYKRSIAFRSYLEGQWHLANFDANYFDFAAVLRNQQSSFDAVQRVLDGGRPVVGGRHKRSR